MPEQKELSQQFADEINRFTIEIESLSTSFPTIMTVAEMMRRNVNEQLEKFLKENAIDAKDEGDKTNYTLTGEASAKAARIQRKAVNAHRAFVLLHRSFLTSMVSQYDSFLGRLLRLIFLAKPEILNASEKEMTFAELTKFDSIQAARDYIVEKEVESIIRKSHTDHFIWLERVLGVNLRVDLEAWPLFIELTERRNLFVHCDGVVSSQYIAVCKEQNAKLDDGVGIGTQLDVSKSYLEEAARCVSEIGIKLAQVTWRKLLPGEIDKADHQLNSISYELLHRGDYKLVCRLLDFACMKAVKHANEEIRRYLVLNRAQAYKWLQNQNQCVQILDSEDWSACSEKLKIAAAVLRDDFETAAQLMPAAEKDDLLHGGYKDWPIFKEFRKSKQFLEAYQRVYGKPFVIETTTSANPIGESPDRKQKS
jgi:hypothetical protein